GRVLAAGGRDPTALRALLAPLEPEAVSVRPAPPWLRRLWIGELGAMTLPWAIYVRPDLLQGDPASLAKLLVHELVHARQWNQHGGVRFLLGYLGDYLRGRLRGLSHWEAYRATRAETEARELTGRLW
ncbi:MAG: hypothetical protein ACRDVM_10285, partial [Acidimicrobiia bacterium]